MPEPRSSMTPDTPHRARLIDGRATAEKVRAEVARQVAVLAARHGVTPGLAAILVGEDPASEIYVRNKGRHTRQAGMRSFETRLPASTSQAELLDHIARLNADFTVHGILVQLPLPRQIDELAVIDAIAPHKDIDGFSIINTGLMAARGSGMTPCTPLGCLLLLKEYMGDLSGQRALVVGRSNIVGKPMVQLLLREHCTVTVAHSRTRDLADECRRADILIAAIGKPKLIKGDWIRPGATVIDVGINRISVPSSDGPREKLVGDVDFDAAVRVAGAITPVPGGVGPMTIACLLRNTVIAACAQNNIDPGALIG